MRLGNKREEQLGGKSAGKSRNAGEERRGGQQRGDGRSGNTGMLIGMGKRR